MPHAWTIPLPPTNHGSVLNHAPITDNPTASLAGFGRWISWQGPGPYRATSETYTLTLNGWRTMVRVYPDAPPSVITVKPVD